jgi:hypothetical protein
VIPKWFSWRGIILHIVVGEAASWYISAPWQASVAAILMGAIKEYTEQTPDGRHWSDFRVENGGPLNGILDVVSFAVGPLIRLAA